MTYCAHLIFCIDDMESVLEAKNGVCLPYIASVLAERLAQLIKQPTLFKTILKSPELNIWDNPAAAMSNSLGRDWKTSVGESPIVMTLTLPQFSLKKYSNVLSALEANAPSKGRVFISKM